MKPSRQLPELKAAIRRLVKAEVADALKGGNHPEDIPNIEFDLRLARSHLAIILKEIFYEAH
jgi:hypothetical protein